MGRKRAATATMRSVAAAGVGSGADHGGKTEAAVSGQRRWTDIQGGMACKSAEINVREFITVLHFLTCVNTVEKREGR